MAMFPPRSRGGPCLTFAVIVMALLGLLAVSPRSRGAELKRVTMTGVAGRMSSASYRMHVTSAPVAGTSGVCPAGTTGSLGFWSFKAPTRVPLILTMDKTFNIGTGVFDVELTWTGRSTLFEIYRNLSPILLAEPGNLFQTTNLCNDTDQNADPFDMLFYSVIE